MQAQEHARAITRVMSTYVERGTNLSVAALAGCKSFVEWRHYPSNDAVDARHGTEFYYHAHAKNERLANEHGHFHVFVRSQAGRRFHHLIGISMDPLGTPMRLFLTNQWVTGESWTDSKKVLPLLARFQCSVRGRMAPVSRWITAMVHLYDQDITDLHHKRDQWHADHCWQGDRQRHLLDRRCHIVAQKKIDLFKRLSKVNV